MGWQALDEVKARRQRTRADAMSLAQTQHRRWLTTHAIGAAEGERPGHASAEELRGVLREVRRVLRAPSGPDGWGAPPAEDLRRCLGARLPLPPPPPRPGGQSPLDDPWVGCEIVIVNLGAATG